MKAKIKTFSNKQKQKIIADNKLQLQETIKVNYTPIKLGGGKRTTQEVP